MLATGMAGALGYKLGIKRRVLAERHSVSFGFSIARRDGTPFDFEALTCYGERTADGIDYLSLFPVPSGMRADLFMFRDPTDPIMRELRRQPEATVLRLLPGLRPYLGDFHVTDKVQNWVMDLTVVEDTFSPESSSSAMRSRPIVPPPARASPASWWTSIAFARSTRRAGSQAPAWARRRSRSSTPIPTSSRQTSGR